MYESYQLTKSISMQNNNKINIFIILYDFKVIFITNSKQYVIIIIIIINIILLFTKKIHSILQAI